jgi:hypothetical protein
MCNGREIYISKSGVYFVEEYTPGSPSNFDESKLIRPSIYAHCDISFKEEQYHEGVAIIEKYLPEYKSGNLN